jgi:hypothetical protein
MGFFDTWNVSGITTDSSKSSEPFYLLAIAIDDVNENTIPLDMLIACANLMLRKEKSLDLFFSKGIKSEKTDAVQFLVAFTSYLMGKDKMSWSWQQVRHHSQGLYSSMTDSPADFLRYNVPLINQIKLELSNFIQSNS